MDVEPIVRFRVDDKILLRQFTQAASGTVFETVMANYDHLHNYMHWMVPDYSLQSAKDFISQSLVSSIEKRSLGFGMFQNDRVIGSIGFVSFDWVSKRTEIGYWIAKAEEGKGIVTRSCRILVKYAFDDLEMNRIEIRCASGNKRSANIPERLGFLKEGVLRQCELRNGQLHDFNIYGLLASDRKRFDSTE